MAMVLTSPLTPLFIDTNLGTHLVMAVAPQDTVSVLKGKIRTEHALCFPKIGEVSVKAVKVKYGTSFYHLSDTMPLCFAFNGVTGNWLLHLDLVPATSIVTSQTETARVITETSLLPEQHNVFHKDCDSSLLPVNGEDRNRDLVANEMPIKKGLIQTSIANSHDRETMPDAPLQKLSAEGDSLVHNVSSPPKQNLNVSSHEIDRRPVADVMELCAEDDAAVGSNHQDKRGQVADQDRRPDADVPEMELCVEDDAAVGSNHQEKRGQVADQGNHKRKGEDNGNVGTGADVDIPYVASKKEKSRKRTSPLQDDQLTDGKSEHPYVGKKKHKKEKDQFSKEHVKDQLAEDNLETDFCSKEISQSKQHVEKSFQEKHVTNLVSSEVFYSKPSHVDSSSQQTHTELQLKKKKKNHLSKNDEAPQDEQVHNPLSKTDAASGKQDAQENNGEGLVNNHGDLRKESDASDLFEGSTKKVLDGSSSEVGRIYPSSTNLKQSDYATERLLDSTTSTDIPLQDVGNGNGNSKALSKESNAADVCKEDEHPSNHSPLDLEIPANSRRSRKKSKTEKDASDSSIKLVNEDSIVETSRNSDDRLSKVFAVAMTDADQDNTIPTKPGVPSEISGKSSQHSRKKHRERTELPNTQYSVHDTVLREQVPEENQNTVNSSRDQVSEENQNKTSCSYQRHPDKEFKGTPFPAPAAAAGNSGLVTSTFPTSPNDKKKRRSQKKPEKIELHHQELNLHSTTHEPVNSSREQVTGDFSKEKSIRHLKHTGKEPNEASIIGEAIENCTTVISQVPSSHNDKKSKRKKKSEKIELPSGQSVRPESVYSLVDNVTEQTPKQSLEHDHNEKTDSHLRHPGEGSEGPGLFGEAAVDTDPAPGHLTVSLNPSDKKPKHSRKKSGKSELPGKEAFRDEMIHSLAKEATKENSGGTLNGGTGMGENSNSETILRETAALESTAELDSVNTSAADHRNSCHEEKKKARTGLIDHSRNCYLDHSLATGKTPENLEKVPRITTKSSSNESLVNSDEIGQNMDRAKPSKLDSIALDDSSDKHEFGHLSAENATEDNTVELAKTCEETDIGTVQDKIHEGYVESLEVRNHRQLAESDRGKINFFKFFDPKENQPEPVKELSSVETESKKSNKEKTKRKKKLNPSPLDSGLPKTAVSQEQHILKKKSQDNDSGKHSLGDTSVQIAKEPKSRKKHGKKDANGTHNPHLHPHDIDSGIGSPRRPHDDRPGKKAKDRESNAHAQVSLSVDEENKHPSRRNSMISGLQSPTHNEEEDTSGLVASSDSTEEDTPLVRKRYRVAVRKVPHGKVKNKLYEEKTSLAPSTTIFNDAGGSSEDEFEISNRPTPTKSISNNSSTSDDSDGDLEETQTSYKIYPGAESIDYHKGVKGTNDARDVLAQSSNMKRRGKPLSTILKSTSSYKKAKLIASQSEFEDSESQDVIPETQPELAFL